VKPEQFFDRIAGRYDRTYAPDAASTRADLAALLEGHPGGAALDLGCGTGRAFPHLVERGFSIVGMDVSLEMLRESSRRASAASVTLVRADLYRRWPFRDRAFDVVLALHSVLAHPPSREGWVHVGRELKRVARPGALIAIDLPEPQWADAHLRRVPSAVNDRYLYEDRDVAIEADIPDPGDVVALLDLPLNISAGPLGARAITARSSTP
jgi:SAM-dependent methyltransferase